MKSVFDRMIERMRPPKGHKWDTLAHRGADALVDLCRNYADVEPTGRSRPHIVIHRDGDHAEVDGIAVAAATVDATAAGRRSKRKGRRQGSLANAGGPAPIPRRCRAPGSCPGSALPGAGLRGTRRIQLHHMIPQSKAARQAATWRRLPHHHQLLVPNGAYWLLGDPEQPDELVLIHRDELAMTRGPAP